MHLHFNFVYFCSSGVAECPQERERMSGRWRWEEEMFEITTQELLPSVWTSAPQNKGALEKIVQVPITMQLAQKLQLQLQKNPIIFIIN